MITFRTRNKVSDPLMRLRGLISGLRDAERHERQTAEATAVAEIR